jgi:hypothetical protein
LQYEVVVKRVSFAMENQLNPLNNSGNKVLNSQCGKSTYGLGYARVFAHFNLEIFP